MNVNVLWRVQLLTLCALVFLFAFHAKTAVYKSGAPASVTPSTSSKLWLNGQKMEVRSLDFSAAGMFWMAVLCLYGVYIYHDPLLRSAFILPAPTNLRLLYLHRYLRPPPVQG
jgi:hypothetical protein